MTLHRLAAAALATLALPALAEITFFERPGFQGRSFTANGAVQNFERFGFNDRASSVIVRRGRYEACEHARFGGRCVVLRPGQYPSLADMGMNNAVSSVRPVGNSARVEEPRYAPPPPVAYDYRPRNRERLFQAEVVAVRAVYGPPERRCWVERERVADSGPSNIEGAIAGAVIGGILGHQVGNGRGNDAATAAGAVAGAALGSQYGSPGGNTYTRNVQRCANVAGSERPAYWDVTYRFRGMDRYVQLARPPGRTITVNQDGEPRA